MNTENIGIYIFGRICRTLFRLLNNHPHINVVTINDLTDARALVHLLKYDSIHGVWLKEISAENGSITDITLNIKRELSFKKLMILLKKHHTMS
jgi:glyceraldehyde 3-phosphate dehydrogenase